MPVTPDCMIAQFGDSKKLSSDGGNCGSKKLKQALGGV
jgi:hypothetical protein